MPARKTHRDSSETEKQAVSEPTKRRRYPGSKRRVMTFITPKEYRSSPEDLAQSRSRIVGSRRLYMRKNRKTQASSSGDSIAEYLWGDKDIVKNPISRMVGTPKYHRTKMRLCRKLRTRLVPNFKKYRSKFGNSSTKRRSNPHYSH